MLSLMPFLHKGDDIKMISGFFRFVAIIGVIDIFLLMILAMMDYLPVRYLPFGSEAAAILVVALMTGLMFAISVLAERFRV